jgi:glycosyltransferase A (GT-A) superfamily protein (DUF2064 family)
VHLVSLVRHESGTALTQERVATQIDERKAARHLLTPEHLAHTITTADALYTQVKLTEQILAGGGHYLMAVKRNQPSLYEAIALAFAGLRNAILALLRFEGWPSPPTAFRHFDAHPQLALQLLGAFSS